jgi:hypothetical protein
MRHGGRHLLLAMACLAGGTASYAESPTATLRGRKGSSSASSRAASTSG